MKKRIWFASWLCIFMMVCTACGGYTAQPNSETENLSENGANSTTDGTYNLPDDADDTENVTDIAADNANDTEDDTNSTADGVNGTEDGTDSAADEANSTENIAGDTETMAESGGNSGTESSTGLRGGVSSLGDAIMDSSAENNDITEEPEEQEVLTLTITATGDCTLGATQTHSYSGSFYEYYDNYGETYFFADVRDIFEADDFTLVNLECVLTNSTDRVDKTFNLKGYPEYVGILTSSSIEGCSLGNNHTMDYGWQSLIDTQDALDGAGVVYGYNDHLGIYTAENGLVIGIVSASLLSQSQSQEDYIQNGIEMLKEQGADLIIACCHWGIERDYYPSDYQTNLAHKIVDWGADLVIGNHPHVLQGIEYYNGKVICYSLGNFCFGGNKNPSDKNTAIYQQTFTYVDGILQDNLDARIIPCTVSSASGYNDFQPTVAEGDTKSEIIEKMNDYCAPYSDIYFNEDGKMETSL